MHGRLNGVCMGFLKKRLALHGSLNQESIEA